MKKILYTLLIACTLYGCDVNVENPNTLTTGTFWKTEADATAGVNAIYNMFYKDGGYTRWIWFRLNLTSDEGFSQSPWAELKEWTQFKYTNYNFAEGNATSYTNFYEAIFRANQVLTNVPNITFTDDANKKQLLAQAYFLRGLYYYDLALIWGSPNKSLAIVLQPSTPDMRPEGHTGSEVYQQAISDFTEAAKDLPEQWGDADKGRATKGAALAFRAKCYMQLHQWADAQTDISWLVDGAGKQYYDLTPNYADNFRKDTENNKESVFEIQFSDANAAPAGDGDFAINPNMGEQIGMFYAPPGIGWTDGELRPWLIPELKKEKDVNGGIDIRLKSTAFYEGMEKDFANNSRIYHLTSDAAQWSQTNYKGRVFNRKYASDYYRDYEDYYNPTNIRLIRFADVLLMYAECIAETGGDLSKAVAQVNRVRARANMPALAVHYAAATTDKNEFLKQLQMERSHELFGEGQRWADIKRWGLLDTQAGIDELKSRDSDFNNFVVGRNRCSPIPSSEVNNNSNIQQNPNY